MTGVQTCALRSHNDRIQIPGTFTRCPQSATATSTLPGDAEPTDAHPRSTGWQREELPCAAGPTSRASAWRAPPPRGRTGSGLAAAATGSTPITIAPRTHDPASRKGSGRAAASPLGVVPGPRSANGTRGVVYRGGSGPGRARIWDDVVYTCRHQRLFCSESCVSNGLRTNGTAATTSWISTPCGGSRGAGTTAGWNAATPAASRRQRGNTYGLPDLPASSGALTRTNAADSLSR